MWSRRATLRWKSKETVMAVAFSADDRFVASGNFDGSVTVFDLQTGGAKLEFNISPPDRTLPVTALRFHPTQPVLFVSGSDGTFEKRDVRNGEIVFQGHEEGNEIYAIDYRRDGLMFATAGSDGMIRVYDDSTNRPLIVYNTIPEHSANRPASRMYSVVFSPDDMSMLIAGGWGNTVHVFDTRVKEGEKTNLFGPYLTGDALDVRNGIVLAASNRLEKRLELIDSATGVSNELTWPSQYHFCPYAAKFSKDANGEFLAVAGGGSNGLDHAAFVLERRTNKCVVDTQFESTINTLAFSHNKDGTAIRVAFGDSAGSIHVFERTVRQGAGLNASGSLGGSSNSGKQ